MDHSEQMETPPAPDGDFDSLTPVVNPVSATTAGHTPGPWKYDPAGDGDHIYTEAEPKRRIANVYGAGVGADTWGDNVANARLIAAVPDYYKAAEAIREFVVAADRVDGANPCSLPHDLVVALLNAHRKAAPNGYADTKGGVQ